MSLLPTVAHYLENARAAGVEAALVEPGELAERLIQLLSAVSSTAEPAAAMLPARGWPRELRKIVESTLTAAGITVVSPQPIEGGYRWERDEIARAGLGITFCAAFLADTGSMVAEAGTGRGTLASLLPEIHLALSYPQNGFAGLVDYLMGLNGVLPSRFTLITGPSRTGDIEASMTTGVHGPGRVIHWILSET